MEPEGDLAGLEEDLAEFDRLQPRMDQLVEQANAQLGDVMTPRVNAGACDLCLYWWVVSLARPSHVPTPSDTP